MMIEKLIPLRFGFYKLIYIRPTQFCPLSCRHCCGSFGFDKKDTATTEDLRKWVHSVGTTECVEWIGIEGGEPFAVLSELRVLLSNAQEYGLSTGVLTSAFWALNDREAKNILSKIPLISFLVISADEFHEEFVPLARIAYALEAGLERGSAVGLQICKGPNYEAFMERLHFELGENLLNQVDILITPLQYIGRARNLVSFSGELEKSLPEGRCLFLGTPVIREDGAFVACCQQEVVLNDVPVLFHLGNMNSKSIIDFMSYVDSDVFLQTLRVYGPKFIAQKAVEHRWNWQPAEYRFDNICELCINLTLNPQVVESFRNHYDNPEYRHEIALARLACYGETWPWNNLS